MGDGKTVNASTRVALPPIEAAVMEYLFPTIAQIGIVKLKTPCA
jgi:hypothetical protein